MKKNSDFKFILIIIVLLVLAVFGTIQLVNKKQSTLQETLTTADSTVQTTEAPVSVIKNLEESCITK